MKTKGQLVKTYTQDDLELSAFYIEGDRSKPVVIHVHGYDAEFFMNEFVHRIGDKLAEDNFAFITIQTRGSGIASDFHTSKSGVGKSIGGDYELLEEAYIDIDAWIDFLKDQGYKSIVLEGHSLGNNKITRYLFEGKNADFVKGLVCINTFEKTALIEDYSKGKYKDHLIEIERLIKEGRGREIVPMEYDDEGMSLQTYYSWYKDTDFSHTFDIDNEEYDFPILRKISVPVHFIIGEADDFFSPASKGNYEKKLGFVMKQLQKGSYSVIKGADHDIRGQEDDVASSVSQFLRTI